MTEKIEQPSRSTPGVERGPFSNPYLDLSRIIPDPDKKPAKDLTFFFFTRRTSFFIRDSERL